MVAARWRVVSTTNARAAGASSHASVTSARASSARYVGARGNAALHAARRYGVAAAIAAPVSANGLAAAVETAGLPSDVAAATASPLAASGLVAAVQTFGGGLEDVVTSYGVTRCVAAAGGCGAGVRIHDPF